MSITVTVPIVSKPHRSRHAGGHSGGHAHSAPKPHAPRVVHVRAPHAPHAPKGITAEERAQGTADNADLAASLGGGYPGTGATLPAGATPYTGPYNAQGLPDPHTPGTIKIKHIPIGPAPHGYGIGTSRGGGGAAPAPPPPPPPAPPPPPPHPPAKHAPPATHARKITAPLQLTDSGLLGHDSHISSPPALAALAPIVRRRPGH
jgi:hypothetical protein